MPMLVPNLSDPEYSPSVFMGLCSKLIISTGLGGMREGGWAADSPLSSEFQREVVVMVVVGIETNYMAEALTGPCPHPHGHTGLANPVISTEAAEVG